MQPSQGFERVVFVYKVEYCAKCCKEKKVVVYYLRFKIVHILISIFTAKRGKTVRKLTQRTEAVVNLRALEHNVKNIRARLGSGVEIMAVLKGDGYGLTEAGVDQYGVNQFDEATVTLGTATTDELYLQANVTPNSGAATAKTDGTKGVYSIKASTEASLTNYCILPPQMLTGKKINLTLKNGGTKSFTIPQEDTDADSTPDTDVTAEPGKVYTYTVTVGLYSISVTATVGDWTEEAVTGGSLKY